MRSEVAVPRGILLSISRFPAVHAATSYRIIYSPIEQRSRSQQRWKDRGHESQAVKVEEVAQANDKARVASSALRLHCWISKTPNVENVSN